MRISNIGLTSSILAGLQRTARELAEAESRAQSGLRVQRPSDDPRDADAILTSTSSLRSLEQFQRNANRVGAALELEEGVLTQLSDALVRARQLGIQEGGSNASPQTRLVAKAEVDQLLALGVQLANTRHEGEYLFGGDQSLVAPVTQSVSPFIGTPVTGHRMVEIAAQTVVPASHNATEVFQSTGVLAALEALSTALGNNDSTAIAASLASLDGAHGALQSLVADVGARVNQLELTQQNLASLEGSVRAYRSGIQDIDLTKAITELVTRQQSYQAAMLAASRMLNVSLADYLV